MKNVLLIGDSIRIGYDKAIRNTLEGKANVYFPDDNCRFASYILRYLNEYKEYVMGDKPVDVLHWNAGLWDCLRLFGEEPHTPLEIYTYYIDRICKRIKNTFPEAKVIFATSTSVQTERMSFDKIRYNEEIEEYNAAAVEVVTSYGFEVNDLYAASLSLPADAHSDEVHFYTPMGTRVFTEQVLSYILPALGIDEKVEYMEELYTDKPSGF
ncbi:MAG: hypothetical protein J6C07_09965 [Lachnospiraceae bacterium]|nr:hypothetical protein [Lachnospiraceae bacterium]